MAEELSLDRRAGLPDALCVLLREHPRDLWASHRNFDGLTRFWLERHLMFRALVERIDAEAATILDRSAPPERAVRATARYAQLLLSELDGHHRIEDLHHFPRLAAVEPRLSRGFDLLDGDHHSLDGHMARLAGATAGLIRTTGAERRDRARALSDSLAEVARFLDRHLLDEEDLIVPILLRHGAALEG